MVVVTVVNSSSSSSGSGSSGWSHSSYNESNDLWLWVSVMAAQTAALVNTLYTDVLCVLPGSPISAEGGLYSA